MLWDGFWCCVQGDDNGNAQLVDVSERPADETDGPPIKTDAVALPMDDTTDRAVDSASEAQLPEASEDDGSDVFIVVVDQDGRGLGLDLDITDEFVPVVTKVGEGTIQAWNRENAAKASDANLVRRWDGLVRINGQRGSTKELVALLQQPGKLELVFRRPTERTVVIPKDRYQSLGMMLETTANAGLLLAEIQDGLLKARYPEVQVNERIIAVNDEHGTSGQLWDLIEDNDTLTLKLLSYARKP
eukprot:gb/GFBE01025972.1/.p1 GENE.gb/GFBE01025972.1/~~gb/GFBE01025972.1/.p1  ORF type:complete len:244 (+),score=59.42 gb/GFBE01025972.1/:1-732(+)